MNYPFLYKILTQLDIHLLTEDLQRLPTKYNVWGNWALQQIESKLIRDYLVDNFPYLEIYKNLIFISQGTESNFHIDRFHYHHLLHRLLIPLDDHFHYEWIKNEKTETYQPKVGEVILFNNMIPHRFISNIKTEKLREVIYIDLVDPQILPYFSFFSANYSLENGELELKYNKK